MAFKRSRASKEKEMKNLERKIVDYTLSHNGVIFGGYVRDLLAGVPAKDIDIRTEDSQAFVYGLLRYGFTVRLRYTFSYGFAMHRLNITDNNECVAIEVATVLSGTAFIVPDVNVNRLEFSASGISYTHNCGEFDLQTILDHIHRRVFVREYGCKEERLRHMIDKGWKEIEQPWKRVC